MVKKAIVLWLVIFSLLLVSCRSTMYNGIEISNDVNEYSEDVISRADTVIYDLLYSIAKIKTPVETTALKNKVRTLSSRLTNVLCASPVPEDDFTAFMDDLSDKTAELVTAYRILQEDKENQDARQLFISFYRDVLSVFGAETSAQIAYDYLLSSLTYECDTYEEHMQEYYGKDDQLFQYYQRKADSAIEEKKALESITQERFVNLCTDGILLANLLAEDFSLATGTDGFSSMELLLLYREMNFDVALNEAQWEALMKRLSDIPGNVGALLTLADKKEDTTKIGDALNHVFSLLASLQKTLTPEVVGALCSDEATAIDTILAHLSTEEETILNDVFSLSLSYENYQKELGKSTWGQTLLTQDPITLDAFKALPSAERPSHILGLIRGIFRAET